MENNELLLKVNASSCYEVKIKRGIFSSLGDELRSLFPNSSFAVITDDIVDSLYGNEIEEILSSSNLSFSKFVFKNGEGSKTLATAERIYSFLNESSMTRGDVIISLGGGIVSDLAGFVASSYLRGIKFINIPTTLLSMVDASVGGKTGVNTSFGKNQVGAFWQPSLVLIDPNFLKTLPKDIFEDGIAEIIKYGVISDKVILDMLSCGEENLSSRLEEIIYRSIKIKKDVCQEDEKDNGKRMMLNFGHTIAHAIEAHSSHRISHGKAVAIGMVMIEGLLGYFEDEFREKNPVRDEISSLCWLYNLPTEYKANILELFEIIKSDKKRKNDEITIVLSREIGSCFLKSISLEMLKQALEEVF